MFSGYVKNIQCCLLLNFTVTLIWCTMSEWQRSFSSEELIQLRRSRLALRSPVIWAHHDMFPLINPSPKRYRSAAGIQAPLLLWRSNQDSHGATRILGDLGVTSFLSAGLTLLRTKGLSPLHPSSAHTCRWAPALGDFSAGTGCPARRSACSHRFEW